MKYIAGGADATQPVQHVAVETRAVPNICFVFTSGPNSGLKILFIFGRIVTVEPNMNSDHSSDKFVILLL